MITCHFTIKYIEMFSLPFYLLTLTYNSNKTLRHITTSTICDGINNQMSKMRYYEKCDFTNNRLGPMPIRKIATRL